MDYHSESQALDREILGVINAWHQHGAELTQGEFNDLALRLFDYQLRYNAPYARYCERLGVTRDAFPASWEAIPAIPAPAFKEATLATFDARDAALTFETSGTTDGRPGRHYLETPALYDAALLAGFDRFMLADDATLRYFNCVPNPRESPHSSLGYMMKRVAEERGDGETGWYLRDGELLFETLKSDLRDLRRRASAGLPRGDSLRAPACARRDGGRRAAGLIAAGFADHGDRRVQRTLAHGITRGAVRTNLRPLRS